MTALLRECTDISYIYGVLIVKDVPQEVVQKKIYDIKATLGDDYTIEDVLDKFPEEWEWSYDSRIEDLVI